MLKRERSWTAGDLTKRATLQAPQEAVDADGQIVQAYPAQGTVWANLRPLRGGEAVMQSRMQSRSPAIITVRASSLTRRITSEWRAVIDGKTYHVKEDPRETQDRAFLEFLAEARE